MGTPADLSLIRMTSDGRLVPPVKFNLRLKDIYFRNVGAWRYLE